MIVELRDGDVAVDPIDCANEVPRCVVESVVLDDTRVVVVPGESHEIDVVGEDDEVLRPTGGNQAVIAITSLVRVPDSKDSISVRAESG